MKHWCYLLLCAAVMGCERSPVPEATRMAPGLFWWQHTLGEGALRPGMEDSVLVAVRIAEDGQEPGSLYSTERWFGMSPELAAFWARMRSGDSATVVARNKALPWQALGAVAPEKAPPDAWYRMQLVMRRVRTPEEAREVEEALVGGRSASFEDSLLVEFFARDSAEWKDLLGVRYRLDTRKGHGERSRYGDQLALHYRAYLLGSDRLVDDTRNNGMPLTFRLGDKGQVVPGLEIAVQTLREGDRGVFILPSDQAFGASGSASGIVPPWTPMRFEVERVPLEGS